MPLPIPSPDWRHASSLPLPVAGHPALGAAPHDSHAATPCASVRDHAHADKPPRHGPGMTPLATRPAPRRSAGQPVRQTVTAAEVDAHSGCDYLFGERDAARALHAVGAGAPRPVFRYPRHPQSRILPPHAPRPAANTASGHHADD